MEDKKSILVIDDSPTMRKMTVGVLVSMGYEVAERSDGTDGIRAYDDGDYNLVITDYHMPGGKNGMDVIKHIVKSDRGIPVVMLSTMSDGETQRQALACGASGYVVKPFVPNSFKNYVKEILSDNA